MRNRRSPIWLNAPWPRSRPSRQCLARGRRSSISCTNSSSTSCRSIGMVACFRPRLTRHLWALILHPRPPNSDSHPLASMRCPCRTSHWRPQYRIIRLALTRPNRAGHSTFSRNSAVDTTRAFSQLSFRFIQSVFCFSFVLCCVSFYSDLRIDSLCSIRT